MRVCMHVWVRGCVCVCVCEYVCECVSVCVCVRASLWSSCLFCVCASACVDRLTDGEHLNSGGFG